VDALICEAYRYLGEDRNVWRFLLSALASVYQSRDPRRLYQTYCDLAAEAGHRRLWAAEGSLREEAVRLAMTDSGDIDAIVFAIARRAQSWQHAGFARRAESDLSTARRLCGDVVDIATRRLREADLLLTESQLVVAADPRAALGLLERASPTFLGPEFKGYRLDLYLERAKAHLALGQRVAALADTSAALAEFEDQRGQVKDERLRRQFAEVEREVFEIAIGLLADRSDGLERSFEAVERAHGRTLLDAIAALGVQGSPTAPLLSLHEIRRQLPVGVVGVEFAVLEDRILAWVVRRDGALLVHIPASRRVLADTVQGLRAAFSIDSGAAEAEIAARAAAAYQLLLAPLRLALRPGETVILVPDRMLAGLPFSALKSPVSGRFLIEDFALAWSQSLNVYVRSVALDGQRARGQWPRALIVGDPSFDRAAHPKLSSLPAAGQEAQTIAQLYGRRSLLLTAGTASKGRLLEQAGSFAIVHVASHTVADRLTAAPAYLLLAAEKDENAGMLGDLDVRSTRFSETRLIVLAACGTGDGPGTAGEGVLSLARSFLAAGVPSVVATQWPIDDHASSILFTSLHRHLLAGEAAASALRHAQLDLLGASQVDLGAPATWAGIQVFNGTSQLFREGK